MEQWDFQKKNDFFFLFLEHFVKYQSSKNQQFKDVEIDFRNICTQIVHINAFFPLLLLSKSNILCTSSDGAIIYHTH